MWLVNIFKNVCLVYMEIYLCFQKFIVLKLFVIDVEYLFEKEKKKNYCYILVFIKKYYVRKFQKLYSIDVIIVVVVIFFLKMR